MAGVYDAGVFSGGMAVGYDTGYGRWMCPEVWPRGMAKGYGEGLGSERGVAKQTD